MRQWLEVLLAQALCLVGLYTMRLEAPLIMGRFIPMFTTHNNNNNNNNNV